MMLLYRFLIFLHCEKEIIKGRLKTGFQTAFLWNLLGLLSIYLVLHYNCANLTHSKENKLEGLQQLVDLLVGFVDWILKLLAFLF